MKPHFLLNIVSFLKLIHTTAGIDKFLLAGKERMTLVTDIHFQRFNVLRGTRLEGSAASAYNRNFVIFGMYFGLHLLHLADFLYNF